MRLQACLLFLLSLTLTLGYPRMEESPRPEESSSTTAPVSASPSSEVECFYRGRESCPPADDPIRCRRDNRTDNAVLCCDVDSDSLWQGFNKTNVGERNVTSLHIINATLSELDSLFMTKVRWLKSLALTDGSIQRITQKFHKFTHIVCLNLSNNGIESIEKRALCWLNNLRKLDLSRNNLTDLPNFRRNGNITLDISNNNKTACHSLMNMKNSSTVFDFENVNHTFCSLSKSFQWFNSTELLRLQQVDEVFNAQKNCWPNCTCEYVRTVYVEGKLPTIAFKVDCSGKQLTEMPRELPKNTIILNISNNNINVLKMEDELFGNIRELYADNNQIKSILSLEGTKFLDNFIRLSLKNNSLKTLPMYMLSSYIFDRNQHTKQVHLGQNRLHCDCNTAKNLKLSLLAKQKYIPDYDEIYCEKPDEKVIHLNPALMCQDNHQSWTDYIYYIITMEVLLLLFLVLKVSYDYWVFKTAGYLPWPANKMPKLPCDWLCE